MRRKVHLDRAATRGLRERIIELLIASKFARDLIPDDRIDEVAKHLGVDPDALVEARVRLRLQRKLDGYQVPLGRKKRGSRHYQLKVVMPREVFEAWKAEAARRGVDSSALLRSLLHSYLLGSYEPPQLLRFWSWRGQRLKVGDRSWEQKHGGAYPYRDRALITSGALRALRRRAASRGSSDSAIVRALVLEILEGGHERLRIVDAQTMYDDETRYRMEPGVVD